MSSNKIYELEKNNKEYPKQLLKIRNSPKKLYVIGNIKLLQNKSIAIVGTRTNTLYGEKYTKKFSSQIASLGITIVSGLAEGIDSIAHKSAIYKKGKTIAVLGAGFNNIFPKENEELFKEILKGDGCIVSEYSPNTLVDLSNFPKRNRIIAGLSNGVLVTEAKFRSGSSITARYAFEQEKPVFCIPNQLGIKTGVGTNILIKKGAHLITDINDILIEIGENPVNQINIEEENEKLNENIINKEYNSIYQLLMTGPIEVNELCRKLQGNISEINQKLTMMEIEGLVEILPGNIVKIRGE